MALSSDTTAPAHPSIALHVLVLESPHAASSELGPVVQSCYPGSLLTIVDDIAEAREKISDSVFDLVVIATDSSQAELPDLIAGIRGHTTSMPVVMIVPADDEERLLETGLHLCSTWEIVACDEIRPAVLERRIRKAIANHQRRWELQHLQQAFQSSLVQYRNLFDEVPDLIFLCDRSGCLLDVNSSAERLFGRSRQEMLMQPIFETFGLSREDFDRMVQKAIQPHAVLEDAEIEFRPPGREPIFGLMHLINRRLSPNRPPQFQGVVKDISPHKRLEQRLRRSEDRYKSLYDMARVCASSLRLEDVVHRSLVLIHQCCGSCSTILLLNDRYEQLTPVDCIEFPHSLRRRLTGSDPLMLGHDLIGSLCIRGGLHRIDTPSEHLTHEVMREWVGGFQDCQLIAIAMGRGNPTLPASVLLMLVPTATAEQLEDELLGGLSKTLEMGMTNCFHYANSQETESRYRELWDHAPAFFVSLLRGGILIEINKTAIEALGYEPHDLIGKSFKTFVHPADHDVFQDHHDSLMATGLPQDYELRLLRQNGEPMIVSFKSEPLNDRDGNRIGEKGVLYDITRDKIMEARLRDYAENLERMVENRTIELTETMNFLNGILEGATEYAIVALDETGRFLHFNRGAQLLFEYDARQMVGQESLDILLDLTDTRWASLADLLAAVDQKGVLVEEIPMRSADQRQMIALLTINQLKTPTANNLTYVAIIRDITEQREMEDLLKLYTENLQQVIEEKSRELDRQHIQLIQSSKLATLGEMATGIAHELNQPLSGIRTRAQLVTRALERDVIKRERIIQNQTEVIQLVDRISNIITHMRIFARQDQQKFNPFKLSQSVQGAMSLIGEQLRIHAIETVLEIEPDLPFILGEPLQLEQVILNLVSNARDALDARAELERQRGRPYHKKLVIRVRRYNERELALEVEDNGIGISEEVRTKIFEPFYTTKPVGRGTGLGLSISYGILTNHNGRMELESEAEQGSCFRVLLPVWDGSAEVAQVARREDLPL